VGAAAAIDILRFRLAHIEAIINVAEKASLLKASQARIVDDYDAYMHPDLLKQAKADLERFLNESPDELHEGFGVVDEQSFEVRCLSLKWTQIFDHSQRNFSCRRQYEVVSRSLGHSYMLTAS
jgi:hypothetical protein